MSHRRRTGSVLLLALAVAAVPLRGQETVLDPDDTEAARAALETARANLLRATEGSAAERARWLTVLGLPDEAEALLADAPDDASSHTALAFLAFRRHRYEEAEQHVRRALGLEPDHRDARMMLARLHIQAWDLPAAVGVAKEILGEHPRDAEAALLIGRVRLLEKRYDEALAWADTVRAWDDENAGAWLLEADTRFWDQDPAGAEPALRRALELNPFDADARFAYGYAIWRRVDATQLDDMAAQWDLALATDPLHYITHWHWGNGHTNLTYADYAHPTDSIVRVRLEPADRALSEGRIDEALRIARAVESEYPASVLPAMLRGSAFYLAGDMPRAERLDSAQATFEAILARKAHYGPAHNGLAAVIKQRQFQYLTGFDSLEAAIAATPLPDDPRFFEVFSDARYYPGDRVLRMIRAQLGPTAGYVPMLHRQRRNFTIPPLHKDLAEAQDQPSFRYTTTFDNRQWMDIRGVGGGSTGIEYVERGAHWERNVLIHEYAHLFHGNVLTDAENRRIRALYYAAMEGDRTLDYYASNNESEFFAQAWEAYTMPKKVHPLNHKSMNTREDLRTKDPALYAFVDSMAHRLEAALAGDTAILRSNWAETYVNLSRGGRRGGDLPLEQMTAMLDTALIWDDTYVPALVRYGAVLAEAGRFAEAGQWLDRAEDLAPRYAPIQVARADLLAARTRAGELDPVQSLEYRIAHYRRALELEDDLSERASLNGRLRRELADHGLIPEAIRVAEEYVREAPTISTYLRDRRDEALAFALELRAAAGHAERTLEELGRLVAAKPFNYTHRAQYADALAAAGRGDSAIAVLESAQRVLRAAGEPRTDYAIRIAALHAAAGRHAEATRALEPVLGAGRLPAQPELVRVLAALGMTDRAAAVFASLPDATTPAARAEHAFANAALLTAGGDGAGAEAALRTAVREQPYHVEARLALLRVLVGQGRRDEAAAIAEAWPAGMELPPGPDYRRRAGRILRGEGG